MYYMTSRIHLVREILIFMGEKLENFEKKK